MQTPDDDKALEIVATLPSSLDARALKWALQAEGILVFLGGHAMSTRSRATEVFVLRRDAARAREVLADGGSRPTT